MSIIAIGTSLLLQIQPASAIINPKMTPVQVTRAAQAIYWGTVVEVGGGGFDFRITDTLKGKAEQQAIILSLSHCKSEELATVRTLLKSGRDGAILFTSTVASQRVASLHVGGTWLSLKGGNSGQWDIEGISVALSAVYAGGTDMLPRMVRYILADPAASVPVSAGASWMAEKCEIGKVAGEIAGMEAVQFTGDQRIYLYVASAQGDRIYRAKQKDEGFEDVTGEMKLASRSRRYCWIDLEGKGRPALASWDEAAITIWQRGEDGVFQTLAKAVEWNRPCLGLAACSLGATGGLSASAPSGEVNTGSKLPVAPIVRAGPAVLISTDGLPVLMHRDARGKWHQEVLPDAEFLKALGPATSACIVADLDNDGFWDVLQPRMAGGVLWKGGTGGFSPPVKSAVACSEGPAHFALGDFDGDGSLDIFLAGVTKNELWENDGHGNFKPVLASAGSLGYKSVAGLSACRVADLNHDGRPDLCLLHREGTFTYHFNRGFRCFGEEGDLRLGDVPGQIACAVADFNGDGSLDLAVALADGTIRCFYNDTFNKAILRVGLASGIGGPVTVSVWQGEKDGQCMGTLSVESGVKSYFAMRSGSTCTIKWFVPGAGMRTKKITLPAELPGNGLEVLLDK